MDSEKQPEKNMNDINPAHLEPRVARLEVGLETLTRNVSEMATSIRENANATNAKIDQLAIAVTQAAAPKKTDWSMIISACLLMMAIGSAVFWPLNQTSQNNKQDILILEQKFEEHQKLTLHPVGAAKIENLEKSVVSNKEEAITRDNALDAKLQRETALMTELVSTRIADMRLQKEFALRGDLIDQRLLRLEQYKVDMLKMDQDELRNWRLQKMGGPLVTPGQSTSQAFPAPTPPTK